MPAPTADPLCGRWTAAEGALALTLLPDGGFLAEAGGARVKRIGIPDRFGESAPYERLLEKCGITREAIMAACQTLIEENNA